MPPTCPARSGAAALEHCLTGDDDGHSLLQSMARPFD